MAHNVFATSYGGDSKTNRLTVIKFGGSSLADAVRLQAATEVVSDAVKAGKKPIVIVSAMGKTTNMLLDAGRRACDEGSVDISLMESKTRQVQEELNVSAKTVFEVERLMKKLRDVLNGISLLKELSCQTQDYLMSFGERISCRVFAGVLNSQKIKAEAIDAFDAGMMTSEGTGSSDSERSGVEVLLESYEGLRATFEPLVECYSHTPVVTGFVAKNKKGLITTLGRSGSDFTAAIIGAAISAREIEIWTDVDGILTTDPHIVPEATTIDELTFQEAAELAFFGAKVIHPRTVAPAMAMDIPVRIRNSYNPRHPGTLVLSHIERPVDHLITALTLKRRVHLIDINSTRMLGAHGFLAKVFSVFSRLNLSVDVISTSEVSVSLTLERHTPEEAVMAAIENLKTYADITVQNDMAIITLIGNADKRLRLLELSCKVLGDTGMSLEMVSCGASKINISLVVRDEHSETALRALHTMFFESKSTV